MIWKQNVDLNVLNQFSPNTLVGHLDIQFSAFGDDFLQATMPVDERTRQPLGLLHGGASVSLAETIGSVASTMCLEDLSKFAAVGLEINANHLKSAKKGRVTGTCRPIRIGRSIHVWNIEIHDDENNLVCVSRLTMAIIKRQ